MEPNSVEHQQRQEIQSIKCRIAFSKCYQFKVVNQPIKASYDIFTYKTVKYTKKKPVCEGLGELLSTRCVDGRENGKRQAYPSRAGHVAAALRTEE